MFPFCEGNCAPDGGLNDDDIPTEWLWKCEYFTTVTYNLNKLNGASARQFIKYQISAYKRGQKLGHDRHF